MSSFYEVLPERAIEDGQAYFNKLKDNHTEDDFGDFSDDEFANYPPSIYDRQLDEYWQAQMAFRGGSDSLTDHEREFISIWRGNYN